MRRFIHDRGVRLAAGLAVAAQRVVTAFAGYLIIMRGNSFTVGDRIKMGGVHGETGVPEAAHA